jgi:hypothetical protein
MSPEQLAKVFPNGRTVHIASNGKPMAGYDQALADIEKRGNAPSSMSLAAARDAGVAFSQNSKRLLTSLFRGGKADDEEDESTATVAPEPKRGTAVAAIDVKPEAAKPAETARIANVPLPAKRPAMPTQVASIAPAAAQVVAAAPASVEQTASVAQPISSVVASRWDDAGSLRQIDNSAEIKTASIGTQITSYATLAYATGDKTPPAKPGSGLRFTRKANAGEVTTDIAKSTPRAAPAAAAIRTAAVGDKLDDIWLRAVMLAPDLRYYLSATLIGAPDPKELRALMQKPKASLALTFSADPMDGMVTDRFTGEAVVFPDTISFVTRTAALQ